MKKVVKFGGSSLASAEQFKKVGDIIRADEGRRYVVPSAPGKRNSADTKVTDMLYDCYRTAVAGRDFKKKLQNIKARYQEIIDGLNLSLDLSPEFEKIAENFAAAAGEDYAASRGEYLNGIVMANYLGYTYIDSAEVICFDENGNFLADKTDEVLSKAKIEHDTGHITADVLQTKDVNGNVFHEWYNQDILEPYFPKDICSHIDEENLKYGYPLYASQSMWYYNTKAFPDGQPIHSWWEIIEKNEDGTQKYRLFTKEIGQESAYLSLFASFINNADEMAQSYKDTYGKVLEYTYDASDFNFEVPEKNAGVEYLWRFSQAEMTFIGDGDELVLAVHNSTADEPALCLASAGKIGNRDESGYNIAWCLNLEPYTALLNLESLFIAKGTNSPAGARLFVRYITGGADGQSEGMKPFKKEGNWPVRDDVEDKKNPAKLSELGARANDLSAIYYIYPDVQDMWTYWLSKNPKMK